MNTGTTITTRDERHGGASDTPPVTPTVFVVVDDTPAREALEALIESAGWRPERCAVAHECPACRELVPSCLVLDVALADVNAVDLQQGIAANRSDLPVILISGNSHIPTIVRAMRAGAVDFLVKPLDEGVLLEAIRRGLTLSRRALDRDAETKELRENYALLTPREREVMALVTSGLLNKQVGGELGISEITVKAHRGRVMRKMQADSLPALVRMAASLRIVPAPMN